MDHNPVFRADDMVTVEGFEVEMLGIAFPMDAGFVLPDLQDLPFGNSTLNGVHVSDSLILRLESLTRLYRGHQWYQAGHSPPVVVDFPDGTNDDS